MHPQCRCSPEQVARGQHHCHIGARGLLGPTGEPFRPGLVVTKRGAFIYRCPVCAVQRRFDDAYGLACTGPSEARDDHVMTPMVLIGPR